MVRHLIQQLNPDVSVDTQSIPFKFVEQRALPFMDIRYFQVPWSVLRTKINDILITDYDWNLTLLLAAFVDVQTDVR